jgi:hypothetical protein
MEAWRVYRTVVEQDLYSDPHYSKKKLDSEPHDSEKLDHIPDPHLSDSVGSATLGTGTGTHWAVKCVEL